VDLLIRVMRLGYNLCNRRAKFRFRLVPSKNSASAFQMTMNSGLHQRKMMNVMRAIGRSPRLAMR
jgi:hypothetical protein